MCFNYMVYSSANGSIQLNLSELGTQIGSTMVMNWIEDHTSSALQSCRVETNKQILKENKSKLLQSFCHTMKTACSQYSQ